jgi:GntR family transcriptional regulator, histidine utilization repressor
MTDKTSFRNVKAAILTRITDGPWGPGTLLPGEVELATEFGCSRATVNRAMREVSELGLLDRRRKAGTRVRMAPLRQARFEIPLVRVEVENTGAAYRYALVQRETVVAPDWLRARMNSGRGDAMVHLICMHYADGMPYQLEDRWINVAALPQVREQRFTDIGPNEWLIATVPFSQVEISFQAIAADAVTASHLSLTPGEPVFCVERTTWWQGAAITHVRLNYRRGHRMTARY